MMESKRKLICEGMRESDTFGEKNILFPEGTKIFRGYVVVLSKLGKVSQPYDLGRGNISKTKGL